MLAHYERPSAADHAGVLVEYLVTIAYPEEGAAGSFAAPFFIPAD
jgi:hypothetical protein